MIRVGKPAERKQKHLPLITGGCFFLEPYKQMNMKKYATALWHGSGKEGSGKITTESYTLNAPYNWKTRFTEERGTNPEELIAAAHAGCFTMKLSFLIN